MTARGKARKRALDVLYSAEIREVSPDVTLRERTLAEGAPDRPDNPYVAELVEGVQAHRARIDEILATYSSGWALDRMPAVDRNILRIALFELLWRPDVPAPVVIDQAVELARQLSTDESPGFVNGILARILELRDRLTA